MSIQIKMLNWIVKLSFTKEATPVCIATTSIWECVSSQVQQHRMLSDIKIFSVTAKSLFYFYY